MMAQKILPEWIEQAYNEVSISLHESKRDEVARFYSEIKEFKILLEKFDDSAEIAEIYKITPEDLKEVFPDPYTALAHACEFLLYRFLIQHVFKLKALFSGIEHSLECANWLLASNCCRSIYEEISYFHYFGKRVTVNSEKTETLIRNEKQNLLRGKQPEKIWIKNYIELQLNTLEQLQKALEGSDYDWISIQNQIYKNYEATSEHSHVENKNNPRPRKTHINDCLRAIEKAEGIPALAQYAVLSEMVHPNFGSNTLVLYSRNKHNHIAGDITLSPKPKNTESLVWFFEFFITPMADIFKVAIKNINYLNNQAKSYQDMAIHLSSKIRVH